MVASDEGNLADVVFSGGTAFDEAQLAVLVDQYKLFVETSEKLVARRQLVNTFFLSVNTLAMSAVGLVAREVGQTPWVSMGVVAISIAAIMLCIAWKTLVRSYAQLNRGKFAVIECIECHLPAALFTAEWEALGKGQDSKRYKPFTRTEEVVSNIFIWTYVFAALIAAGVMARGWL